MTPSSKQDTKIFVVGVSSSGLDAAGKELLASCRTIVASSRYRPLVEDLAAEIIPIAPVNQALAAIREALAHGSVGVLASGDPLFFGIGRTLLAEFGESRVEIRPALSFVQQACARFKMPWDDARVVSLHGREADRVVPRLLRHPKVIVFTDRNFSPDRLAGILGDYLKSLAATDLLAAMEMRVAENLGQEDERLTVGRLAEMVGCSFMEPNLILLSRPVTTSNRGPLGLSEPEIAHSRGLITKDEVRSVTLHKLALPASGVFWDIGAGSGSISIEAARLCPGLEVMAVEKKAEQLANIRKNILAFEAFNVLPRAGSAPEILSDLPDPDRVFVGGSSGRLAEIIELVGQRLKQGRVVVNCVTDATRQAAPLLLADQGYKVETVEISVARKIGAEQIKLNPITVVVGKK